MKEILVCECGRPNPFGHKHGCEHCRSMPSIPEKCGVSGSRTDGFRDVNEACTRWLRERGLAIGDKILPFDPVA